MSSVSADNQLVTRSAREIRELYQDYLSGLRGLSTEILAGLNNGTKSFLGVERELDDHARRFKERIRDALGKALVDAAQAALGASSRASGSDIAERSLAIADTLVAGFMSSVSENIEAQVKHDKLTVDGFMRRQLSQGRFFATSEELNFDLVFKFKDKSGRQIDSDEYVFREANWALRQHYNSILLFSGTAVGLEQFVVDGGSRAGELVDLDSYDKVSGAIFHHNSKALLQPTNYSVS